MSIGAYIDCDICSDTPFADSAKGGFRKRLREQAREAGWRRMQDGSGRMLDVCPDCVREVQKAQRLARKRL